MNCRVCGATVAAGVQYCGSCGAAMAAAVDEQNSLFQSQNTVLKGTGGVSDAIDQSKARFRRKLSPALILVLILSLLLGAGIAIYYVYTQVIEHPESKIWDPPNDEEGIEPSANALSDENIKQQPIDVIRIPKQHNGTPELLNEEGSKAEKPDEPSNSDKHNESVVKTGEGTGGDGSPGPGLSIRYAQSIEETQNAQDASISNTDKRKRTKKSKTLKNKRSKNKYKVKITKKTAHVEADNYTLDLPEYWWGKVTAEIRGDVVRIYANDYQFTFKGKSYKWDVIVITPYQKYGDYDDPTHNNSNSRSRLFESGLSERALSYSKVLSGRTYYMYGNSFYDFAPVRYWDFIRKGGEFTHRAYYENNLSTQERTELGKQGCIDSYSEQALHMASLQVGKDMTRSECFSSAYSTKEQADKFLVNEVLGNMKPKSGPHNSRALQASSVQP